MTKIDMVEEKISDVPSNMNEQAQDSVKENHQSRHHSSVGDNPAESFLSFFSYAILIIGIVASVLIGGFMLLGGCAWNNINIYDLNNIIGWIIIIGGVAASFIIWASLMFLINISNNLRQIKYELRYVEQLLEESNSN